MSYHHLTISERIRIEVLSILGYSTRFIAKFLHRHHSTIARELSRNKFENNYCSTSAHNNYLKRRKFSSYCGKYNELLSNIISKKLHENWSPEQISNALLNGKLSFKTIYNWIYTGKLKGVSLKNLRHKGKRRKKETRGKFLIGRSITTRPKEVKSRKTFGHWELDTIVSSRGKSKACLATFVERKTRFYMAIKIKDRTAESMLKAIKKLVKVLPKKALKTFTTDRGKEFACYKEVEKINIKVYFADAYAAWQRGSNENTNGLLREYYPKKTDLGKISNDDLIEKLILLNSRPRKCLNWDNPFNLFLKEVSHLD